METRVLIVEDETIVALDLEHRLKAMDFGVVGRISSGAEAISRAAETAPDVVLMDIQLRGELDGIEAAGRIQRELDIPVIFLTAFSDQESLSRAKESQAYGYLLKPFQERELAITIELALYKHSAEGELRRNRALLRITLNNIEEGVITTDSDNRIVLFNEGAARITGWNNEDAIGQPLNEVVRTRREASASGAEDTEVPAGWTLLTSRGGREVPVAVTHNALDQDDVTGSSFVVVIRDVAQEREYRRKLLAAKQAAEASARAKSDFLARVSHELRTPLNTILGMTDLIRSHQEASSVGEYTDILDGAARQLSSLITDVLDYARYDTGKLTIRNDILDPYALLENLARSFSIQAHESGLRLALAVYPTVPHRIYCDEKRLTQILSHLLSNAIKFTPEGHVLLSAWSDSNDLLHVAVQDTGVGIPPARQTAVFEDFSQLEDPATRRAGGVGLGLAIVRRLVGAMGGTIGVRSEAGDGATFSVELPASAAGETAATTQGHGRPADPVGRVLTDDELLHASWRPWCDYAGITIRRVDRDTLRTETESGDVVLTTADGVGDGPADGVHMVVVTRLKETLEEPAGGASLAALTEPVPTESIVHTLSADWWAAEGEPRAGRPPDVETPAGERSGLHILLVDDDRSNLVVHQKIMESRGYEVTTARSAAEALDAADRESFDAVLMDIEMPDMSGWDLAEELRRRTASVAGVDGAPGLVALTGHSYEDIAARLTTSAFNEALTKPTAPDRMDAVVRKVCRRAAGDAGRREPETRSGPPDSGITDLLFAVRTCVNRGDFREARDRVIELRKHNFDVGTGEAVFRLLLAVRRGDADTSRQLVAKIREALLL